MGPKKQLRIVKVVKIIDGIPGSELNPLDLLEVQVKYLLLGRRLAAKTDAVSGFLQGILKLAVKKRGQRRIVHLVISRLRRIIHHLAPV